MNSGHHKECGSKPSLDAHNSHEADERVGLIFGLQPVPPSTDGCRCSGVYTHTYALKHLIGSFVTGIVGGIVVCLTLQLSLFGKGSYLCLERTTGNDASAGNLHVRAAPWVGSTYVNNYPPTSPTNDYPSLFPSDIGYLGATPTGAEPAIIATAPTQPLQTGAAQLVAPASTSLPNSSSNPSTSQFNIFRSWGNLSPWYSVPLGAFGINEGAAPPAECSVKGLHLLYRHGARYDSASGGTASLAKKLHNSTNQWNATGSLTFLNDWTYKLGQKVLTAFGRQQLYDLGVSMRLKYGFLLNNFTADNELPVFRTLSDDRLLASTVNFALGFFGWPLEGQYEQAIQIEATGFNTTLSPASTCPNSFIASKGDRGSTYVNQWKNIYLENALKRLQADLKPTECGQGFNLSIEDVYDMQQMCAYETVALGYSKFCELFTEDEWEGFDYSMDLSFWYDSAFGSPVARVLGLGYVQELVSRLTHTPIETYNSSTNSTWDADPRTWPLNDVLYADTTHDNVIANILTALNLTMLAASGPLPADHIPSHRSFMTSKIVPFASNVQFQLLSCPALSGQSDASDGEPSHIRIVVNDGPVPLSGVGSCPSSPSGLCPLTTFIEAQQVTAQDVDWIWGCYGNWSVPAGTAWETSGGWYPPQP